MQFEALIFDCDGTLADTMPAHFVAWRATMVKYGIHFTEDRHYQLGGVPTQQIIEMLAEEAMIRLDAVAIAHEKEMLFHASLHEIRAIEAVVAIAKEHHGRLPLAVATGSMRWSAERVLRHIGVWDMFDALVGSDDVTKFKPEPDVYLEAARRLGVRPEKCRAFEDTDLGIESARRAGMDVVDVRPMYQRRLIG